MKIKTSLIIPAVVLINIGALAGEVYVSPDGDDTNPGTIEQPFKTITAGINAIGNTGGLVYLREGIYYYNTTLKPEKSGLDTSYNRLWAYPGEKVIIDFSGQIYSSSSRGINLARSYWHLKGLEVRYAGDNGIIISGSHNIVENCVIHHCKDTGLQISNGGSYNIIINCDSYLNYDSLTHGENADGFAPKLDIGSGNEFHGCRAWSNSDDGWDMYEGQKPVLVDSCWAFRNGWNVWGDLKFAGDGNGFKFGGNYVPAAHIATHCVAFDNAAKGFDQNHNTAGVTVYNCTGWRNGNNFSFPETPDSGQHVLKNDLSYYSSDKLNGVGVAAYNSWNGFTVSDADFQSLDTALALLPRNADGSLPESAFLRLTETSSLVNAGTDLGLTYFGDAPDIGALEWNSPSTIAEMAVIPNLATLTHNYPNPFNPETNINFSMKSEQFVDLTVCNLVGQTIVTLIHRKLLPGEYSVRFDGHDLPSGIYFCRLMVGEQCLTRKMILMR